MLPINPLISNKIKNDNLPEKIKTVLNEILNMEDEMEIESQQRGYRSNLKKVLERYADDEEIKDFCENYE